MTKHKRVVIPGEIDAQKRRDRNVKNSSSNVQQKRIATKTRKIYSNKLKLLWNTEIIMELWNIRE